MTSLSC